MNTKAIAKEYRLAHWAEIMRERQDSGLSIRAYCKQAGFHENIYFYWQRKLREAACQEVAIREERQESVAPDGWALCERSQSEPEISRLYIEIGKCRITVNADTDQGLLSDVCRMLMPLC